MPLYMCPSVAVDKMIIIGPESFSLPLVDRDGTLEIMPPSVHTGIAPVNTRLISARCRSGQVQLVIIVKCSVVYYMDVKTVHGV